MIDEAKRYRTRTVRTKILENLDAKGPMRFSKIKEATKITHDEIIRRELNRLMEENPPLILKSSDKIYSLNRDHPGLGDILRSYKIIPAAEHIYPVLTVSEAEDVLYGALVITSKEKGLDADLCTFFAQDEATNCIAALYKDVLLVKLLRVLKNKLHDGEIQATDVFHDPENKRCLNLESDVVKQTWNKILEEGAELHILPEKNGHWKRLIRPWNDKEKKRSEDILKQWNQYFES